MKNKCGYIKDSENWEQKYDGKFHQDKWGKLDDSYLDILSGKYRK